MEVHEHFERRMIQQSSYQSSVFIVSGMTMFTGYLLFVTGVVMPSWRLEIGYVYGLWVRCDEGVCQYSFTGFKNYLAVVQSGIIVSLLLMTTSIICILLESLMKICHVDVKHISRTGRMAIVTAAAGEIMAACSLGFYGCQTVMKRDRLPVLGSGFALTGVGIIVSLIGNILKTMGPLDTWGDGICCLAPRKRCMKNLPVVLDTDASHAETCHCPRGFKGRHVNNRKDNERTGLISCFHDNKNGYSYSSVPSTISSSLDRGYRHYEEISFEDMPPPPLEMLNQFPQVNSPSILQYNDTAAHSQHGQIFYNRAPFLDQGQTYTSSPLHYTETKQHQQHNLDETKFMPVQTPERQSRQSEFIPAVAPRQINQQRSAIKAAQRQNIPVRNDITNTSTQFRQ